MGSHHDSYFAQFLPRTHGSDSTWVDTLSENILSLGREAWQYQAGGNGDISVEMPGQGGGERNTLPGQHRGYGWVGHISLYNTVLCSTHL